MDIKIIISPLIILIIIFIIFILFIVFLYFLSKKINLLENIIIDKLRRRTDIIPWLFEISKNYLVMHKDVFENIIKYRVKEYAYINYNKKLSEIIYNESLIHKEINFILKIINSNKSISSKKEYLYIKKILYIRTEDIWKYLKIYKWIIKRYNILIFIKNLSFIWLLFPLSKKMEI